MEPIAEKKETLVNESPEALFERKRQEARKAMEGHVWTEKRERSERDQQSSSEKEILDKLLVDLATKKEKLELDWITLDDQRKIIGTALAPILEQEKVVENEEARLEIDEVKTIASEAKQGIEKERWSAQEKRRQAEQEKWGWQEKLFKIEQAIENNTQKYRLLLDEGEVAQAKLNALKALSGDA